MFSHRSRAHRPAAGRGFALLEVAVALAILGLALLLTLGVVARYQVASERSAARLAGLASLEAAHETLRARSAPIRSGRLDADLPATSTGDSEILIEVRRLPRRGLQRVVLTSRIAFRGELIEQRLVALFWEPSP